MQGRRGHDTRSSEGRTVGENLELRVAEEESNEGQRCQQESGGDSSREAEG